MAPKTQRECLLILFEKKFNNSVAVIIIFYLCKAFTDQVNVNVSVLDTLQITSNLIYRWELKL